MSRIGALILAALAAAAVVYRRRRISPRSGALGGLAVIGLVAYGTGLIDPPDAEPAFRHLAATLGPYIYVFVGLLAFLETAAGAGLLVPGEIAVILGGVTAGQGRIELPILIAIVWSCALAGDLTSFVLARSLGRDFLERHGARLGMTPQRLQQAEHFYASHGGKAIVVGRFIGFVRPLSPLIAGASKMPARRFIPATAVAAGLWAATFSVLGYVFSQSLHEAIAFTERGTLALSAVVVVVVVAVAVHRRLVRRRAPDPADRARPVAAPAPPAGIELPDGG